MPLALTDSEMDIIFCAARPLRVEARDAFLQDVAERLVAMPHLGDGVVHRVCAEVQREHWEPPVGPRARRPAPAQVWNALESRFKAITRACTS
jgi:hypothetical protein